MPALSDEVFCAELLRRTFIAVEENGVLKSSLDEANGKLIELYKTLESLKQENIILQNAIISHQEQFTSQSLELETVSRALDSAKQKESASLAQIDAQQHQLIEASKSRQYTDATVQARLTLAPVIRTMRASRQGSLRRAASAPPGARSSTGCGETSRPSRPRKQAIRIPAVRKATSTLTAKPTPSSSDVQIPEARRMVLQAFTAVSVPESSEQIVTFTRRELSTKLGGSMQGVDGTFGRSKPLATTHDLHGCIFPQRQTNPWLPASPGDHGYMFVGLKGPFKDDERFREPTTRALFIPEGKSGWRYYGLYVIQRKPENDLTVDEWNGFPDKGSPSTL